MTEGMAYAYHYVTIVKRSVLLMYRSLLASYPRKFVLDRPLSEGVNSRSEDLFLW